MATYKVVKAITNNMVRAISQDKKNVILTGNGIGFKRKQNDIISDCHIEQVYTLYDEQEAEKYDMLVETSSPKLLEISNRLISYIQSNYEQKMNEHIHVALSDHICFLIKRCKMNASIGIPIDFETEALYPKETEIARNVVKKLEGELDLEIPSGEVFLIALHIISALDDHNLEYLQKTLNLIEKLTKVIEYEYQISIDRHELNYSRLCIHLKFLIERAIKQKKLDMSAEICQIIRANYPECYGLSWLLVRIIQEEMGVQIDEMEVIYLSLHMYRFSNVKRI